MESGSMGECKHPATRTRFHTINDPKTDERGDVVLKKGAPVYQTVLVGMCCECGKVMPKKVLQEYQVEYDKDTGRITYRVEV